MGLRRSVRPAIERRASWIVMLFASLSVCKAATNDTHIWAPVELSCSVYLTGDWDFMNTGNATNFANRCTDMVQRVKDRCGGKKINFIPTHYWVDLSGTYKPDYFCYKFSVLDGSKPDGDCRQPTQDEVDQYSNHMNGCFTRAVTLGYDIEITPHLDDGLNKGGWRNMLDFDPLRVYGFWSYYDVIIKPLLTAVAGVMRSNTKVYMAMQGEMSFTVIKYPASYSYMASMFIKPFPTAGTPGNLKVGVNMNFFKLNGARKLTSATAGVNAGVIQQLFNQMDFIGINSFGGWSTGLGLMSSQLETAVITFIDEIKHVGVDLPTLINVKNKEFHLSEAGIGGGLCANGTCPARTAVQAGMMPYFGIYGRFSAATNPWSIPATQAVQSRFYNLTLGWLAGGGGPTVRVDSAYIWSYGSWDIAAIHPDSLTAEGSYYNPNITASIKDYNTQVNNNSLFSPPPPNPPPPFPSPPPPSPAKGPPPSPLQPVILSPTPPPWAPSQQQGGGSSNNTNNTSQPTTGASRPSSSKDLEVGTIVALVAGCTVGAFVLVGLAFFVTRWFAGANPVAKDPNGDNVVIFAS